MTFGWYAWSDYNIDIVFVLASSVLFFGVCFTFAFLGDIYGRFKRIIKNAAYLFILYGITAEGLRTLIIVLFAVVILNDIWYLADSKEQTVLDEVGSNM